VSLAGDRRSPDSRCGLNPFLVWKRISSVNSRQNQRTRNLSPRLPRTWTSALTFALWLATFRGAAAEQTKVDFGRDIQPIFIKRCFECHGPDKQKGGLRLDRKEDALKGGKSGKPFVVAGKSTESELIHRVTTEDADDVMPAKGERLTPDQINALRAWIERGAIWPEEKKHWAFSKPDRPNLPEVRNKKWARNEIDYFILARLEKEKLNPSSEAERTTLIRRLSLDLTGLPPTLEEVDAFLKDRSKQAYENLVERLLASTHYGEHFARWWLDLARYADSNGYQVDLARSMWPYREWVINAFNQNMPFDQFTIEQLAGDLLPNATLEQKVATGFNRNTKTNDEGGGDDEEYRTKAVKDRVATTAATWLGLTMMCAECHTHKYDPISHEEYYRFYSFFNNTVDRGNGNDPNIAVPAPVIQSKVDYVRSRLSALKRELAETEKKLPAEQAAWERRIAGKTKIWSTLELTHAVSTGGAVFTNLPDGSILATGVNPTYDTYQIETESSLPRITAVLLEVLPDPSLPKNGPGRWGQTGNFILDEFGMTAGPVGGAAEPPQPIFFRKASADWEQQYYRAEHAIDHNPKSGWAIGPKFGQPHFLIAQLAEPLSSKSGARLGFRFDSYHGNNHLIGRLRLSVTSEQDPEAFWPLPETIAEVLAVGRDKRTSEQEKLLAAHYRTVSPMIRRLEREIFRLNEREAELANMRYTSLVMKEGPERTTYIHERGNFLEKGKVVIPGVPAFLPALSTNQPTNRLALAQWFVSPENPLTARVTVNRLWERVFGTGIVKTSEDLGKQGETPSHPELLDWLACEFRDGSSSAHSTPDSSSVAALRRVDTRRSAPAWDVKHMLKIIVMSATYRQNATVNEHILQKDPYNRLLARGPRFRMDPEMIRDQALAASGLLNLEIGGPSVYPVQVPNLWKELGFLRPEIGMDEWPTSDGPDLYRRGLYTFWRRVCTYPTFATFDAPSREVCISRRPRSNTPLQALATLNDPVFLEIARVLAQRILLQGPGEPEKQAIYAFRLCLARPPIASERQRLVSLYQQQLKTFEQDPVAADQLIDQGSAERPPNLDKSQLAAWMVVSNVLLNLDETVTKE
jgi:mono/diheme cytochrome c family protein